MFFEDEIVEIYEIECDSFRYDLEIEDNHNFFANGILVHNCQNLGVEIEAWSQTHSYWEISEKLEGSSMTAFFFDGEFGVCSRNQELKEDETNSFWQASRRYSLREKLTDLGRNIALQGELIGPGIQNNIYGLIQIDFVVFDVYDIQTGKYLDYAERITLVNQLGLKHVPVIEIGSLFGKTVDNIIEEADGQSQLNPKTRREGIVFKHAFGGASFKVISNAYLEKQV